MSMVREVLNRQEVGGRKVGREVGRTRRRDLRGVRWRSCVAKEKRRRSSVGRQWTASLACREQRANPLNAHSRETTKVTALAVRKRWKVGQASGGRETSGEAVVNDVAAKETVVGPDQASVVSNCRVARRRQSATCDSAQLHQSSEREYQSRGAMSTGGKSRQHRTNGQRAVLGSSVELYKADWRLTVPPLVPPVAVRVSRRPRVVGASAVVVLAPRRSVALGRICVSPVGAARAVPASRARRGVNRSSTTAGSIPLVVPWHRAGVLAQRERAQLRLKSSCRAARLLVECEAREVCR